ncbi:restriction endonuclease subunit S [Acinetobacter pittii]|uniref:restriction endonuclease subunit S n=1 Tax=Acinetobacter pittii TaxID=48296 RepID=UPI0021CD8542|nr:restriction endonuclease subunit S [Acinetobacter pittii]MCU4399713.1 restriction endonuclease subunit S [Acinetobacter pittii]MCU4402723.1 restriction endonuclease subunit S [Acinetobacter pittii]MCU4462642.1 restriction endonuclease subunit S [Acinetobacter pittii]
MSTDLNMEYQEVKFGEIAKHISKRVEPSETTLEVYVGLEHLDPDSLKITRHGVPSDVAGQKLLVKKGQIIFGKRRAYQRKVAVADWDCICSAHAMVLEAIPGKILPELLPFFMQSNCFMERAISISEGSLSPTIKWKTLENQKFKIPTIEHQSQLLNILNKIEECLHKTHLLKNSNDRKRSILFDEVLSGKLRLKSNVGELFKSNWSYKTIKDLGVTISGGTPNTSVSDYWDGDIVWVTPTDITKLNSMYIFDSNRKITAKGLSNSSAKLVPSNTLLVCTRATIGYMAITSDEMCTNQGFKNLIPYDDVDVEFLYYALQSQKQQLISKASGSTFLELSKSAFESIELLTTEYEEQKTVSKFLKSLDVISDSIDSKVEKLTNLKNKVLNVNIKI